MINKKINYNDDHYYLQIWDTSVNPNNNEIFKEFYAGAKGSFLIYDITSIDSFTHIRNYNKQIDENIRGPYKILIGFNSERENRAVTAEEGKKLAEELGIDSFFEIPSNDGNKIKEMINILSTKKIFDEKSNSCLIN